MRARSINLLTVAALAALMGGIALTAPRWARWLSEPIPAEEPTSPNGETAAEGTNEGGAQAHRTIAVRIFFPAPEQDGLIPEERSVEFAPELAAQVKNVVAALTSGSTSGLASPFPEGTGVLEVFLTARGVGYVSLTAEAAELGGGSTSELLAVYSVVNTVVTNFPSIKRVQILVQERMVDTLAGHVDLSRPLAPDYTLMASPSPSPSPSSPTPPSPPSPEKGPAASLGEKPVLAARSEVVR
jgi:spore germination protein GerM